MKAFLRAAIVVALTATAVAYTAPDIVLPWHPWVNYGMTEGQDSRTTARVTTVTPGASAARAGVRVGDTIDLGSMPLADRRSLWDTYNIAAPGTQTTFVFLRNGSQRRLTLVSEPYTRTLVDNITDMIQMVTLFAFPVLAMVLLLIRPAFSLGPSSSTASTSRTDPFSSTSTSLCRSISLPLSGVPL